MGEKLYFGDGVPVDKKKAGEWLKKAVDGEILDISFGIAVPKDDMEEDYKNGK